MLMHLLRMLGVVIVILVTAAGAPGQTGRATATIKDVAWLEGTWVSASGQRTVEERWTPPAGGVMFAVSRTLTGDRLAEFEYLRIVERGGGLYYVAQPNGRPLVEPLERIAEMENHLGTAIRQDRLRRLGQLARVAFQRPDALDHVRERGNRRVLHVAHRNRH